MKKKTCCVSKIKTCKQFPKNQAVRAELPSWINIACRRTQVPEEDDGWRWHNVPSARAESQASKVIKQLQTEVPRCMQKRRSAKSVRRGLFLVPPCYIVWQIRVIRVTITTMPRKRKNHFPRADVLTMCMLVLVLGELLTSRIPKIPKCSQPNAFGKRRIGEFLAFRKQWEF